MEHQLFDESNVLFSLISQVAIVHLPYLMITNISSMSYLATGIHLHSKDLHINIISGSNLLWSCHDICIRLYPKHVKYFAYFVCSSNDITTNKRYLSRSYKIMHKSCIATDPTSGDLCMLIKDKKPIVIESYI